MQNGSIKLFRAFGIDVFLHWSWFLVAIFLIPQFGQGTFVGVGYEPILWSTALYLALFAIVVLHEYGHALACKSVGGQAKHIVLWPLGGVAFVQPPQRPGAVLWSIVAGPLVNVLLIPVTVIVYVGFTGKFGFPADNAGNLEWFLFSLMAMNFGLLVFNMLPIYPLDGGQTLMAVLWFFTGRAVALQVVGIIGMIGAGLLFLLALFSMNVLMIFIAGFVGLQAWSGLRMGTKLAMIDPRHFDDRYAKKAEKDEVEERIQDEVDPWRR